MKEHGGSIVTIIVDMFKGFPSMRCQHLTSYKRSSVSYNNLIRTKKYAVILCESGDSPNSSTGNQWSGDGGMSQWSVFVPREFV